MRHAVAVTLMIGAILGGVVWFAAAQAAPTVYVNQPFDLVMTHDGLRTTSYHLAVSGPVPVSADLPVSAFANGRITFALASGLPTAGNYSAVVTAIGEGGSTPSDPFAFVVSVRPAAPSKGVVSLVAH